MRLRHFFGIIAVIVLLIGSGCSMDYRSKDDGGGSSSNDTGYSRLSKIQYLKSSDIDVRAELITDKNGDNVLAVSHEEQEYMYYRFTKRGNDDSDEADSSGTNAAILAYDSANLVMRDSLVFSSGDHAHGVFSLGSGTEVVVSDCVISTRGGNSSGIITSDSGIMTLVHVTSETLGANSPSLFVRDGGGSIIAERGWYFTSGASSPAIRSEGDIAVSNAKLESALSPAIILEGKSSVALISCDVYSGSEASSAVTMYMDTAGNSALNAGNFSMTNGGITCDNGDIFYVSNSTANIYLNNVSLINNDETGVILRAEASTWGTAGVNGGKITLNAESQNLDGDIYLDGVSDMNMTLTEESYFTGTINSSGTNARIFVGIEGSKWVLTGDSHIDSLTCEENSITLNGHNLYVNGAIYEAGTSSSGKEIDFASDRTSSNSGQNSGDDSGGEDNGDENGDENGGEDNGDNNNGEDGGEDNGEDNGDEGNGDSPATEEARLSFDAAIYTTGTVNGVAYRQYGDISYVANPVSGDHQKLSIYIPEPYFSSRPVNGYLASTAPIFIPNNSSGYMAASIVEPSATNPVGLALSRGLVVVSPALRGRNVVEGYAPAGIVDYKAAVRYIRANRRSLPAGNTDRIIACGVSSGGALSALLGVSGNSTDYDSSLEEIGAAEAEDNIYAAAVYCPVTNLENADGAYEWIFGGEKYGEDSLALIEEFSSYVNSLGLEKNGNYLMIDEEDDEYEDGFTFRRYIESLYVSAAQSAVDAGNSVNVDWISISGDKVLSADLKKYADSFPVRQKTIPAFDKFDLSSPENGEFGYKHFTDYSSEHTTVGGKIADTDVIYDMNPMEHTYNDEKCTHWRIRHGTIDRDITITIPAILAVKLENEGCKVDFSAVWEQGHSGYYDTDQLFDWIDSICKE